MTKALKASKKAAIARRFNQAVSALGPKADPRIVAAYKAQRTRQLNAIG